MSWDIRNLKSFVDNKGGRVPPTNVWERTVFPTHLKNFCTDPNSKSKLDGHLLGKPVDDTLDTGQYFERMLHIINDHTSY